MNLISSSLCLAHSKNLIYAFVKVFATLPMTSEQYKNHRYFKS